MFRCRHCEYLQAQLDRVRSDARSDLADARATHEKELSRVTRELEEALRRNDVLQLAVLQGVGSTAGSVYVNRVDRAAGADDAPPDAPADWLPANAEEAAEAPWNKIKRAEMNADKTIPFNKAVVEQAHWIHAKKEEANKAAIAHPPGAFVVNPRPENDLVGAK